MALKVELFENASMANSSSAHVSADDEYQHGGRQSVVKPSSYSPRTCLYYSGDLPKIAYTTQSTVYMNAIALADVYVYTVLN